MEIDGSRIEWVKGCITVSANNGDRLGALTVWDSGEAELSLGTYAPEQVRVTYRESLTEVELRHVLSELLDWVGAPSLMEGYE